jgi:hypothetical protein
MKPIELFHDAPLLPEEGYRCKCSTHSDCCPNDYKPAGYACVFEGFQFDARHQYPTRYLDDRLPALYPFGPEDDPNEVAVRFLSGLDTIRQEVTVPFGTGPDDHLVEYGECRFWVRGASAFIKMCGPRGHFNLGAVQPVSVMRIS